jgi:hypothetical protein
LSTLIVLGPFLIPNLTKLKKAKKQMEILLTDIRDESTISKTTIKHIRFTSHGVLAPEKKLATIVGEEIL